ncbi:kinesin family protein [Microthyrium microscopicum]|uniref:Kinesin family protein n=1 Tax=Microthyrium microscopicum TaxID=703497 RepID=A0A6A6UVX2_9PEZI|nr:kinesin family protein [Microthyrium microscopicum]
MASSGGNIKVVVRVRPFNSREIDRNAKCIVQMKNNQTVLVPPTGADSRTKNAKAVLDGTKTFAFDRSYWSFDKKDDNYAGQDSLFDDLGKPLLDNAFKGYNNCIFAYGQTGSGKSYSMMGYGQEYGVIPRICRDMFDRIEEKQDKNLGCTVEVSYLEIYNERVRDLLNPATKGNLRVREHPSTGPYVEDLAKLVVRSFAEIENLMDEGNKARTVAATNMNETSSRSHAVFTITLTQKRHDVETRMDTEKVAKISLVDLAGSERATSTGATGARLKEGAEINRSLSTLGRVIAALADLSVGKKKSKSAQVPYRDSVLTWLLKDSLGGNSLTAMIAAISPADINFDETLSTLRYADSAKRIKNHAVVNEDPNARIIRELKEELAELRSKLTGGAMSGPIEEQYPEGTPLEQQIVSITQSDGTIKKVSKAEIAEQLDQSEKLYNDLNQTWEQKLQKTEEIQKEREAALEELGITIEKGSVGVSTPKKMPHLVNLSDDPLLAECLVYNIKPGSTTVGSIDADSTVAEIRLNGSKILMDHCTFENVDEVVTVVPKDGAAVMVNGVRVDKPKRLRSGYRIILGDFHIFRFNHPQEARAERAEQGSLLRHSINASDLPTPTRPRHERHGSTISMLGSEGADSPRPGSPVRKGAEDWSFARREAVSNVIGSEQKISALNDDELDMLFEDLQRVRAGRRTNKHESRIFDAEDDTDSNTSYPIREKYASNGTIDNFSLDTILTVPSTPQAGGEEDQRLRLVREDMQDKLDKQKEEYQAKLTQAEEAQVEVEVIKAEKEKMEESLLHIKEEMQKQLQIQKDTFERQIKQLRAPATPQSDGKMPKAQENLAKWVIERWRQKRHVSMAEKVLQIASLLKEAQVLSHEMDKQVTFQFCVIDAGHVFGSSYDLVLNGVSLEDDEDLEMAAKPCIGVRVIDYKNLVVHLWSLRKLRTRIRQMRQLYQYIDAPEYSQHFNLENPFSETCLPQYSRVGDVNVPLAAVFESRVQDFSLDVVSPYTSNVIGIVRLSLEPSMAMAPSSTLKFNVVMRDFIGFAEREGTEVHAQLFVPGISDEGGATTTSLIKDFDEGPVRFESVHSMSLPIDSPRGSMLRVSIFAKVTSMHLDKLLSWDDMRDSAKHSQLKKKKKSRINESEYFSEQRHDVFSRVQFHEISEFGDYQPVEVVQLTAMDGGAFQLHQGLQRRIVISLTHSSGKEFQWKDITTLRMGRINLLDQAGKASDIDTPQPDVPLKVVSPPAVRENADGTNNVTIICQWDSSIHASPLLDRATAERHRIQGTLSWNVMCANLQNPLSFSLDVVVQIRSRSYSLQNSMLQSLLGTQRIVHSIVGNFIVSVQPTSAKRATDLWRMNTQHDYVKGEEALYGWTPRGISLVQDFIKAQKQMQRVVEVETARSVLSLDSLTLDTTNGAPEADEPLTSGQIALLQKSVELWIKRPEGTDLVLSKENIEPPEQGVAFATPTDPTSQPRLAGSVRFLPKNPSLLKGGYLLCPDETSSKWVRRYVELRRPYLHVYSVPEGDEINAINLSNSRVDHDPQLALLLRRAGANVVWAVFAPHNSFLFKARSERDKIEWILKIDESYFSSTSASGSSSVNGD